MQYKMGLCVRLLRSLLIFFFLNRTLFSKPTLEAHALFSAHHPHPTKKIILPSPFSIPVSPEHPNASRSPKFFLSFFLSDYCHLQIRTCPFTRSTTTIRDNTTFPFATHHRTPILQPSPESFLYSRC